MTRVAGGAVTALDLPVVVLELRRLFGHRRGGALHAVEQRRPAAQHRHARSVALRPGTALHWRGGLGGAAGAVSAADAEAAGVGTWPAAGGCAQPAAIRVGTGLSGGAESLRDRHPAGGRAGAVGGVRIPQREHIPERTAPSGPTHGASVQDGRGGERRPMAGRLRHPLDPRPRPRVAARQPDRLAWTICGTTPRPTASPTGW